MFGSFGGGNEIYTGDIPASLRFRSPAFLSRTFGTPTDGKIWTLSIWCKRGSLGTQQYVFMSQNVDSYYSTFTFNTNDTLEWFYYPNGYSFRAQTSAVFRDPTSWLHLVCIYDSRVATATNDRIQIWVNGIRQNLGVYVAPSNDATTYMNQSGMVHRFGASYGGGNMNAYLARSCFVDGQALTPSSFGFFNTNINEWVTKTAAQVKAVVDAGGTNSFMLDFDNATSLTTLGYDLHGANLLTYSQDTTNAAWFKSGTGTATISGTAPDSTSTANILNDTSTGDYYAIWQGCNIPNDSQTYTGSIYIKAGTSSLSLIQATAQTGGSTVSANATVTWTGGVPSVAFSGTGSHTITDVGAGWYRLTLTYANNNSGNTQTYIIAYPAAGAVSNTGSMYAWGAQIERGTVATPYKVTTSTAKPHNDWTLNNFSLTAGTSYDSTRDVPFNTYPSFNTADNPAGVTITEGGMKAAWASASEKSVCSTLGLPRTGKWYAELLVSNTTTASVAASFGVASDSYTTGGTVYAAANCWAYYASNQSFITRNSVVSSQIGSNQVFAAGTILQIAYDADNNRVWFGKDNVWVNGTNGTDGNPSTATNPTCTGLPVYLRIIASMYNETTYFNAGQYPFHASATYDSAAGGYFRYTPPTGFKALCQRNMPDPAILNPEKHFDVLLDTGTGGSKSVSGAQFEPGLVWRKGRNAATYNNHTLTDSVRGVQKFLQSNQTATEGTDATALTSFNSDGFSVGSFADFNTNNNPYATWLWKAGGAAVTNNAGSISSQVSANVAAGFSIVTYTGTGANLTFGHGLGKEPALVIIKRLNNTGGNWLCYHKSSGVGNYLTLNSTSAQTPSGIWTGVTSTTFGVGANATNNNSATDQCVAYCFAEIPGFSKIFSYTGNGSADGPFVYCGFKPKFVMVKNASVSEGWEIMDSARDPNNVTRGLLEANNATAENTATDQLDFTANGFKVRNTRAGYNTNGNTYVGIAFADVPAKYALAR